MKISKVDHTLSGVNAEPVNAGGFLYKCPDKNEKVFNLRSHIETINNKALYLYNIMVPPKGKNSSYCEVVKEVNSFMKKNVLSCFAKKEGKDTIVKKNVNFDSVYDSLSKLKGITVKVTVKTRAGNKTLSVDVVCSKIVNRFLRQSLRKQIKGTDIYVTEIIMKLFEAILSGNEYSQKFRAIDRDAVIAMLKVLYEDYTKAEAIKKIEKSIENKNVSLQIAEDEKHLILSGANNPKKKYVFDFISRYAGADDAKKEELLKHIRYLIVLYVYGKNTANTAYKTAMSAKSFGVSFRSNEDCFSTDAISLMHDQEYYFDLGNKAEARAAKDSLKSHIRGELVAHFNEAKSAENISVEDICWLKYFSDTLEKNLNKTKLKECYLSKSRICRELWNEWLSYIAMKYIEMGKGAFNFAMGDIAKMPTDEEVSFGQIDEKFKNGISSFDYERITAEDNLKRSLSGFVTFAINNFDNSVREDRTADEDILSVTSEKKKNIVFYDDLKRRVLRYFGGASLYQNTSITDVTNDEFFENIKKCLVIARNSTFHFMKIKEADVESDAVNAIFEKERELSGRIFAKKIFSNNVLDYYSKDDIVGFMNYLYSSQKVCVEQVPSFNKVLSRKDAAVEFVDELISPENRKKISDNTQKEQFRSSIYYLLKEIYYFDFLNCEDLQKRFTNNLPEISEKTKEDKKKKAARESFNKRFEILSKSGMTFPEICQEMMTEYNQQNNEKEKKPSAFVAENNKVVKRPDEKQIYKHYRTLLYLGLRNAFLEYVKEKKEFAFLQYPVTREKCSEEDFLNSFKTPMFDNIDITSDQWIYAWYVTAHFLNQKQLNHMIGQIKTYIHYIKNIDLRAKATGNICDENLSSKVERYSALLEVFEFVKLYCGSVTNNIEDYFVDSDEYAKFIAKFVDYQGDTVGHLQAFCDTDIETKAGTIKLGMFYDGLNPIVNRNIVLASMYGNANVLSRTVTRINEKEIVDFYKSKETVSGILKTGKCKSKEELNKYRNFQNTKNRIELVDILTLSELLNDCYSQFINFSYLRERDLMYFQLGYYYVKLFYTDSIPEDSFLRVLGGDCHIKNGAILYEIAAMYSSMNLPLYVRDDTGEKALLFKSGSIGKLIPEFISKYCNGNARIYKEGLLFFEDVDKHNKYIGLRNYNDHFKGNVDFTKSILDVYSEIFGGFFSYNTKLKKSVTYVLPNLLMGYFINTDVNIDGEIQEDKGKTVFIPKLSLKELKTDYLTLKIERTPDKPEKIPARSTKFLAEVEKLINYKEIN